MDYSNYVKESSGESYDNQVYRLLDYYPKRLNINKDTNTQVRNITFQLTEDCNLACTYCYQINKSKTILKLEDAKKFIDILLDPDQSKNPGYNTWESNFVIIDFIGGEPLLEVKLMADICRYFIKRCIELNHPWQTGYMISVGSNGTLYFTPEVQEFIHEFQEKLSLAITLDGNKTLHDSCRVFHNGHGSYDVVVRAIQDWNSKFDRFNELSSKLTIAPANVMHLNEALQHMVSIGYTHINQNCVFEEGWTPELANILYNQLKLFADYLIDNDLEKKISIRLFNANDYKPMDPEQNTNWCGGNGQMLSLDVRGDIFNCVRYMKSALGSDREPLRIGDIENGIAVTEKDSCNLECMRCITRRSQSSDECFNCPIAAGCGWCSAYNYQAFGTVNKRATFTCDTHKAESLANVYYWNKVFRKHGEKELRVELHCPKEWAIPIIGEEEYNMLLELSKKDV